MVTLYHILKIMKYIVCITATSNKRGLLSQIISEIKEITKEQENNIEIIDLYNQYIVPCRGCKNCVIDKCNLSDSVCVIDQKILQSDLVILVAPTYFANVPGIVKNLFDRLYYRTKDNYRYKDKKYILVTSCDTPAPFHILLKQSTGTVYAVKNFFYMVGIKKSGIITIAGAKKKKLLPYITKKKLYKLITRQI
ncbi:MAG: flavodoxin family protein [Lachnospiraceae bacterium]|uniref:flavodoxin family protein n=1 Tax=uncultured Clostridium sp. TaxID=59620 RepID=UPI00272D0714|nr:flavodoxin family protein [uncultured Clostridium sp.]MCI8751987.1 flavodoxin family protein [Lachnospiraceae bacterium]